MTGPGRPTTGVRVDVRIPAETLRAVDFIAAATFSNRANTLRDLIEAGLRYYTHHHIDGTANEQHP